MKIKLLVFISFLLHFNLKAETRDNNVTNTPDPIVDDVYYCSNENAFELYAQVPAGLEVHWHELPCNGTPIYVGDTFFPGFPGTFYVQAFDPVNNCYSNCIAVDLFEFPLPFLDAEPPVCSPNLLSYSVIVATDGYITNNIGVVVDNMDGTFTLTGIPIGEDLQITATSNAGCTNFITVSSPSCEGCPDPGDCDDSNCLNGIEYWDDTICECVSTTGCEYQITSITPSACPPDSLNSTTCLNVCPYNAQVYVVNDYNGEVEWDVIGAESWEVIGNELLVNWGGPGSGLITASGEGTEEACDLQVSLTPLGCSGVVALGDPSYDYIWYDPFGNILAIGQEFYSISPGEYTLNVMSQDNCSYEESFSIPFAGPTIEIVGEVENLMDCSGNDGSINLSVAGGAPPYAYEWSTGSTTQDLIGISNGIYHVTVYDGSGCSTSASFTVDCGAGCSAVVTTYTNPTCELGGSIFASDLIGGANFTITGPNGFSSNSTENYDLVAGTYYVFAIGNEYECTEIIELENQFDALSANVINESECDTCDGQINFSNFENLLFNWSNGSTSPFNQNLCAGVYNVVVSDFFGNACEYSYAITCGEQVAAFETSLCIDILEETEAIISTIPEPINGDVNICAGQTIYFESQSINAETHIWDFGNGENDSGITAEFTYEVPGSYLVQLIARNECLCSDTTTVNVNVEQAIIPKLDCVGTICENTEVTYTTNADCSNYTWEVTGDGTIISGGGSSDDFITINWGVGPLGTIALSVASCTENYCVFENVSQIPIIGNNDEIKGLTNVCKGDLQVYTITEYGGTDFFWEVSSYGEIVKGQGTNTVSIQWTDLLVPITPQWVRVTYTNCYLECGGSDEIEVNILDEYFFSGPIELCINEMGTYNAEKLTGGPASVNWEVKDPSGAVIMTAGPTEQFDLTLTGATGIYTVTATPPNAVLFCSDQYSAFVNLLELPPPVLGIDGDTEICVGATYTYQAISTESNTSFSWEVNDGGILSDWNGGIVNVTWNSDGPYTLTVAQIENSDAACESEAITMNLTKIDDIVILGQPQHCIETTSTFVATNYPDVNYEWTINPETAATIIEGQQTNTIEVFWHSVGNASVELNACSNTDSYSVFINETPVPIVNHPIELCPEDTGPVSTTLPFSNYEWRDTNGLILSTMTNTDLGPGNYELIVEDANGCIGNVIFEIESLPSPTVEISSPNLLTYCPPAFPVPTLYALESDPPYQYQWYRNNVLIPGATMSLYTPPSGDSGLYQVEAVNEYGCIGVSNILNVQLSCGGGGGGPPAELQCQGVISTFDIENTNRCEKHKFQNTSPNMIPGTTEWLFGFPDVEGTSTGDNTSYEFQRSGFYFVVMICDHLVNGVVERCGLGKLDMIPVSPDFHVLSNCVNAAIEFEDLSTFVPGQSVTSWTWDFGDPASGANNTSTLQDPTHFYNVAGTYEVTLLITGPNGCESEITKSIVIQDPPTPSFELPTEDCQNFPLDFTANIGPNVTDVFWDFGDPASGDANTSEVVETYHEYETPGTYTITLTAQTIYGCSETFTEQVTIQQNNLSGVISMVPGSPICEDQITTMTAPTALNYAWSSGAFTSTLTTGAAGAYDVTISDDNGCSYTTPEVILDVLPLPGGEIRVVEYDEYDQPISFFYDSYTICEGDEVFMEINQVDGYTYTWSTGISGTELEFSEERDNLLEAGTYVFDVTIVDTQTGCTNIAGPYTVLVNANPEDILLVSNPDGFICDNQPATISIANYDPDLTYVWNTGTIDATAIIVDIPGIYYVRAFNENGCETTSNEIEIHKGPDINRIPSGCHKRCAPDTLCLPSMPGIVSWQWYFEDTAIPAPEGTQQEIVANESGDYYVEMIDEFGCEATSGIMSLDLFIGTGTIGGEVYFDVNDNGIIDGPDTLMSNQTIFIEGENFSDQVSSNNIGAYTFEDILAVDYTLYFDSLSLPSEWIVVQSVQQSELVGCDDIEEVNWLVRQPCVEQFGVENFNLCPGETLEYHDVILTSDEIAIVVLQSASGCDSTVTVNVSPYPSSIDSLHFEACFEDFYEYNGQQIAAGESYTFEMMTTNGCDSNEVVVIEMLMPSMESLEFEVCEGEMYTYNGVEIPAGETVAFDLMNVAGCDSMVMVAVVPIPLSFNEVELFACSGDSVYYVDEYLFPNSTQLIELTSFSGCDSVEQVTVTALGLQAIDLNVEVCPDEMFIYNGQEYESGTSETFSYVSSQGCDSIIQLNVNTSPDFSFDYEAEIVCYDELGDIIINNMQGSTNPYLYSLDGSNFQTENEFSELSPGDHMVYVQDINGCIKSLPANIPVYDRLNVLTNNATLSCEVDSVLLSAELLTGPNINLTFTWPDGSTGSNYYVSNAGTYELQASNVCEDKTVEIIVSPAINELENYLYIPNIFSPNGDGINDYFLMTPADYVTIHSFEIHVFDRWGEQQYFSRDIKTGWDGTLKNGNFNPGVHVWWLKMDVSYCGERKAIFEKGDITVIR